MYQHIVHLRASFEKIRNCLTATQLLSSKPSLISWSLTIWFILTFLNSITRFFPSLHKYTSFCLEHRPLRSSLVSSIIQTDGPAEAIGTYLALLHELKRELLIESLSAKSDETLEQQGSSGMHLPPVSLSSSSESSLLHISPRIKFKASGPVQRLHWTDVEIQTKSVDIDLEAMRTVWKYEGGSSSKILSRKLDLCSKSDFFPYYRQLLSGEDHRVIMGIDAKESAVLMVFTIPQKSIDPAKVLVFSKEGVRREILPPELCESPKAIQRNALDLFPLRMVIQVQPSLIREKLYDFEAIMCSKILNVAVLSACTANLNEQHLLGCDKESPAFSQFLETLGRKGKYSTFLPVFKSDSENETQVLSEIYDDFQIIFWCSSFINKENDPDLTRRRSILSKPQIVLVFKESPARFHPEQLNFPRAAVFFVVSKDETSTSSQTYYRLSILCDRRLAPFPPFLPDPPVFKAGSEFKQFLVAKLINAQTFIKQSLSISLREVQYRGIQLAEWFNQFSETGLSQYMTTFTGVNATQVKSAFESDSRQFLYEGNLEVKTKNKTEMNYVILFSSMLVGAVAKPKFKKITNSIKTSLDQARETLRSSTRVEEQTRSGSLLGTSDHSFGPVVEIAHKNVKRVQLLQAIFRGRLARIFYEKEKVLAKNRAKIITEIYETEKRYVEILQLVNDNILVPLSKNTLLPEEEIRKIFSEFSSILVTNRALLKKLKSTGQSPGLVANAFIDTAPYFRLPYSVYTNNFMKAKQTLASLSSNQSWKEFFDKQMKKFPRPHNLSPLDAFLIQPVQRIPRYQLLLSELIRHTYKFDFDYQNLVQASSIISEITNHLNQNKKVYEDIFRMKEIQDLIVVNFNIASPFRKLVGEDYLIVDDHRKPFWVIVFSDFILAAKVIKNSNNYTPYKIVWFDSDSSVTQKGSQLQITTQKDKITLKFAENSDAHNWEEKISTFLSSHHSQNNLSPDMKKQRKNIFSRFFEENSGKVKVLWTINFSSAAVTQTPDGFEIQSESPSNDYPYVSKETYVFKIPQNSAQNEWLTHLTNSIHHFQASHLFLEFSPRDIQIFKTVSEAHVFQSGDHLIKKGDTFKYLYIIEKGSVKVDIGADVFYVGAGQFLGERGLLGQHASATVVVDEDNSSILCVNLNVKCLRLRALSSREKEIGHAPVSKQPPSLPKFTSTISALLQLDFQFVKRFFRLICSVIAYRKYRCGIRQAIALSNSQEVKSEKKDTFSKETVADNQFALLFDLPAKEIKLTEAPCTLTGSLKVNGTLYLFSNYLCFYGKLFGFKSKVVAKIKEVEDLFVSASAKDQAQLTVKLKSKKYVFGFEQAEKANGIKLAFTQMIKLQTSSEISPIAAPRLPNVTYRNDSLRMSESDWATVLERGTLLHFSKNDIIVSEGQELFSFYYIVQGRCYALFQTTNNQTETQGIPTGSIIGEISLLFPGKATVSIKAQDSCKLYSMPHTQLHQLFSDRPDLGARFYRYISSILIKRLD